MTPNEATIVAGVAGLAGALVSAAVSFLTTRYMLKHGPNYEASISEVNATLAGRIADLSVGVNASIGDLNSTLAKFVQAAAENLTQQESARQAQALLQLEALWRPYARIEVTTDASSLTNYLILKSTQPFELIGVTLRSSAGAIVADIPITKGQEATGYRISISHQSLLKLKQNANAGALMQGVPGQLGYRVQKGGQGRDFTLPITTEDVFVGNTVFIKLIG